MKALFASARARAEWGAIAWLATGLYTISDLRSPAWSSLLLAGAALVLVPLLLELASEADADDPGATLLRFARAIQLPSALGLLVAGLWPPGAFAAMMAAPWVALTVLVAVAGGRRLLGAGLSVRWRFCRDSGLVLLAVGGAWTLADRLGLHPLGFGTEIVQLTAVHFHYAGLALPVLTSRVLREFPQSRVGAVAGIGVIAGIPLVAVGITWAQLRGGTGGELLAALVLAPAAIVIAGLQLRLTSDKRWPQAARICWLVSSLALIAGMTLALLYAARDSVLPLPWLNIPWMRALHGTANALGFALVGAIGWSMAEKNPPSP